VGRAIVAALVLGLVIAFVAPAWAQVQPTQSQPIQGGGAAMAPRTSSGNTPFSFGSLDTGGPDSCLPLPMGHMPISLDPPPEWRNKHVNLFVNVRQDGSVEDLHLLRPSGNAALDAAAMAQVKQTWRWAPLVCGRSSAKVQVTVGVARQNCVASGWAPPLPLTFAQPDRGVRTALDIEVAPDGRMLTTGITESSGDASLDAAVLAHVRQNWHFWSLGEGCPNATKHAAFRFPEMGCIPRPVADSRTPPSVAVQDRPRAVDLLMGVGPDGKLMFANVIRSSGDAALDAATVAHVKDAWRWQPITCKRVEVYSRGEPLPVTDFAHVTLGTPGVTN